MSEKNWKTEEMDVNGVEYEVKFSDEAINDIFIPFLKKLTEVHAKLGGRKLIAYMAAPPGSGKTTTAQFLEQLSKENPAITNIRALSIDGFHFATAYMKAHFAVVNGSTIPMEMVKGAPETYDVDLLQSKIREVRQEGTEWPIYDRNIHDVVPDAINVEDDIILIEGNYLLLKNPRWTNIRALADYTVFIKSDPEMLKPRLINRKVHGGKTQAEAEYFYDTSDSKNVENVLNNSAEADETWILTADGDFEKESDE